MPAPLDPNWWKAVNPPAVGSWAPGDLLRAVPFLDPNAGVRYDERRLPGAEIAFAPAADGQLDLQLSAYLHRGLILGSSRHLDRLFWVAPVLVKEEFNDGTLFDQLHEKGMTRAIERGWVTLPDLPGRPRAPALLCLEQSVLLSMELLRQFGCEVMARLGREGGLHLWSSFASWWTWL